MSEKRATYSEVIELVKAAIERVKHAQAKHLEAQSDPYSDSDDRGAAQHFFKSAENEFGWQWKNVERILNEVAEMPKVISVEGQLNAIREVNTVLYEALEFSVLTMSRQPLSGGVYHPALQKARKALKKARGEA